MHVSMVSPVYNEEKTIVEFIERSLAALRTMTPDFEMILVNDGSTDNTLRLLQALKAAHPQIRIVNLSRNMGQQAATLIGMQQASGEMVFLLDSDLQIYPEDMLKLYRHAGGLETWEVISGARSHRSHGFLRSIGSRTVTRLVNFMARTNLTDPASTFLLIKKDVLQKVIKYDILAQNFSLLICYLGFSISQVPIEYHPNTRRNSSYSLFTLMEVLFLAVLNYSTGKKTIFYLMLTGFASLGTGAFFTVVLIMAGIIQQTKLATNLLLFFLSIAIIGIQFIFLGIIAYKIESTNRNLGFRQTITCIRDE